MIDRKIFFDHVRPIFGRLIEGQVRGMNVMLDEAERRNLDVRWTAYILATAEHETAQYMLPIIETRQPGEAQNPSVDTAIARLESSWARGKMPWVKTPYWRKNGKGLSYLGRGLPQLTHEENYAKMGKIVEVDLVNHPDMALELEVAVEIMFEGMIRGSFTGKKLADYFDGDTEDWFNARRIINATQKAGEIAETAKKFHEAIVKSMRPGSLVIANKVDPPPPPPPLILPKVEPKPGFWSKFFALFSPKDRGQA